MKYRKNHPFSKKRSITWAIFNILLFVVTFSIFSTCSQQSDPLTDLERSWLRQHDGKIILAHEEGWPPISFTDKDGMRRGIGVDYIRLIEDRLGFRFKVEKISTLDEILRKAREGRVDVVNNIMKTPGRSEYLNFTQPFFEVRNVLITRKDFRPPDDLSKVKGGKVTVVSGFSVIDFLEKNYPDLELHLVKNTAEGLKAVSRGESDILISELPTALHIIEKGNLTNLNVAGTIDWTYRLAIGVRKDLPILRSILSKGIGLISNNEREKINRKWIKIAGKTPAAATVWILATIFTLLGSVLLTILFLKHLRKNKSPESSKISITFPFFKSSAWRHIIVVALILMSVALFLIIFSRYSSREVDLTPEETAWLKEHDGRIRVGPDPSAPPFDFFDKNGNYIGITADYIALIEKRLGISFKIVRMKTWDDLLQAARDKDVDIVCAARKTPERENFLLFTEPFLNIPYVIATRKNIPGKVTMENIILKKLSMVKGYAITEILREKYPLIVIETSPDAKEALLKVSFGLSDAMVINLSQLIYHVENEGITNLRIAGNTGLMLNLAFSSRKDWPILNRILEKTLKTISTEEREAIHQKWVNMETVPFYKTQKFLIVTVGISATVLLLIISIFSWNLVLRKAVARKTIELEVELQKKRTIQKILQENQRKMTTLLGNLPGMAYRCINDENWTMKFVSSGCKDLTGYPAEEVIENRKISYGNLIHPDDRKYVKEEIENRIKKRQSFQLTYRITTPSGQEKWVWEQGVAVFSNGDDVVALEGFITDITQLKNVEANLKKVQNYLYNVVNSMPSILIAIDSEEKVTMWNIEAEKKIGTKENSAIGRKLHELLPYLEEEMEKIMKSIRETKVESTSKTLRNKDGKPRYEEITIFPLKTNGEEGAVIRIDDVTERVKLEEALQQNRKMDAVGKLAGGVAHDFNNMLAGILNSAELLEMKMDPSDKLVKYIRIIKDAGIQAADLTRKLLDFSRKSIPSYKAISIHEAIGKSVELLKKSIDRRIEIEIKFEALNDTIIADSSQIQTVFLNLGINSAHAMPNGGRLTISTSTVELDRSFLDTTTFEVDSGPHILVAVEDTGTGIPAEIMDKIFDPFFTTKKRGEGTGLGLASVYGIVTRHKGAVSVYSEVGRGTVFKIFLPLSEKGIVPEIEAEELLSRGKGTVLLVDDEEVIRNSAQALLEEFGYDVVQAGNGREALKIYRENPEAIDLVLLDMMMPVMDGKECFQELKKIDPDVKVVFSSGFSENNEIEELTKNGETAFVAKPYLFKDLSKILAETIKNH